MQDSQSRLTAKMILPQISARTNEICAGNGESMLGCMRPRDLALANLHVVTMTILDCGGNRKHDTAFVRTTWL
jgi:hypothetical protein